MMMTPLHISVNKGLKKLAMRFIDLGSDVDAQDIAQRTPVINQT